MPATSGMTPRNVPSMPTTTSTAATRIVIPRGACWRTDYRPLTSEPTMSTIGDAARAAQATMRSSIHDTTVRWMSGGNPIWRTRSSICPVGRRTSASPMTVSTTASTTVTIRGGLGLMREVYERRSSQAGLDEQYLGTLGAAVELDALHAADLGRAAGLEPARVGAVGPQIGRAVDHERVSAEAGAQPDVPVAAGIEQPAVHHRVLVHRHRVAQLRRTGRAETGRRHDQRPDTSSSVLLAEAVLFDARRQVQPGGHDPHLDEAHRLRLRVVAFGMLHPGTERGTLYGAGWQDAAVAHRIEVLECSLGNIGDAFDVAMGVHGPDGAGFEAVVVEHAQVAEAHVCRVAVAVEAEMPAGSEPAAVGGIDGVGRTELDHRRQVGPQGSSPSGTRSAWAAPLASSTLTTSHPLGAPYAATFG